MRQPGTLVVHVPHSSARMPPDEQDQFVLNHAALSGELLFQKAPASSSTLTGSVPLLYADDQRPDRPTICLGTDDSHTPPKRRRASLEAFSARFDAVTFHRLLSE
jgi:hypothetical protein